jgi:hypothetical protein
MVLYGIEYHYIRQVEEGLKTGTKVVIKMDWIVTMIILIFGVVPYAHTLNYQHG